MVAAAHVDPRRVLPRLRTSAQHEVLALLSCPGTSTPLVDANLEPLCPGLTRRSVEVRAILATPHPLEPRGQLPSAVAELTANGALVRHAAELPSRVVIVDRTVAVVLAPASSQAQDHRALLVREPHMIASLVGLFTLSWRTSTPFAPAADSRSSPESRTSAPQRSRGAVAEPALSTVTASTSGPEVTVGLNSRHERTLELLVTGATDEAGATAMGVSTRTYRRHVAELMVRVGASSRFQAGHLAARCLPQL